MSITDRLDAIHARADKATEGEWEARHRANLDWLSQSPHVDNDGHEPGSSVGLADAVDPLWGSLWPSRNANADAEFIAHARTDVPALVGALRAVLDMHKPRAEQVLATDCSAEACDCEDGCQTVPTEVCGHCCDIGNAAHHYAYEEGGIQTVLWPCPTAVAIEAALGEGQ